MLRKIKSHYFIRILFSHIIDNNKLKIVKYNKILQNEININLNNYKLFSGRYIVVDTGEKVKEYNSLNKELLFEGEYLNGKRNGKGKEYYYSDTLKFEGEYLNGKRNGKGKEYDRIYGNLVYEGEYLNGKRNGKGKEYDYNFSGNLVFEGEYLNGYKWSGKIYDNHNYITELKDGEGIVKEYEFF